MQKVVQITADGNLSPSLSVIDDLMTVVETCPESTESIGGEWMSVLIMSSTVSGSVCLGYFSYLLFLIVFSI